MAIFLGENEANGLSQTPPNVDHANSTPTFRVLDLIDLGLVDSSWVGRLPSELAARLQELLDNPEG